MKKFSILGVLLLAVALAVTVVSDGGSASAAQAPSLAIKQSPMWAIPAASTSGETRGHGSILDKKFAFDVAFKKGAVTGYLEYQDDSYGYRLESRTISWLTITLNKAWFSGTGLLERPNMPGATVSFSVEVEDNGKPGILDTFRIQWFGPGSYTFYDNVMKGDIRVEGGY